MAAAPSSNGVTIWINDRELQVPKGELIVESVKRLGLEIPIFCYHPRMKPVGMCRMCLVEAGFRQPDGSVRKMPKPQAGCTLPASEGLVVYTDTEVVHRDRKGVLEFLLVNHPLDCPICDRGGECPLQNNTITYGPSTSRFTELKRHLPKAYPLSEYVTLDLERCIQCGRCVRFTEEISGDSMLAFRFRGAQMQPSTFQLREFESKFSGNVIEICPVGALTNRKYRFRARPWDLETRESLCLECGNGCNTWLDHRSGKFVRTNGRTNEQVNEEWTCDKGKFGHDWLNREDRLTRVLTRGESGFVASTWSDAYEQIVSHYKGGAGAALVGGRLSNESMFLLRRLMSEGFETRDVDSRWTAWLPSGPRPEWSADSIAALEHKPGVLVFGARLADEQPIVFLRVRKGWFQRRMPVVVFTSSPSEEDSFAALSVRYKAGAEAALAWALAEVASGASEATLGKALTATGVSYSDLEQAVRLLPEGFAVVSSHSLLNTVDAEGAVSSLQRLARHRKGTFNCYATTAAAVGAERIGLVPEVGAGRNTREILEACADMQISALWLADCDPLALYADRRLVVEALESVEFLVVQGCVPTEAMAYASIVLPQAAPAEQDGTYTNIEGRVQRLKQVLPAPGDAKASWRIFAELLLRTQPSAPYFSAQEVLADLARQNPLFGGADQASDSEGIRVDARVPSGASHA